MGAWGSGPLENDAALDLIGEMVEEQFDWDEFDAQSREGYLDADTGDRILALVELALASLGARDLPDQVDVDLDLIVPFTTPARIARLLAAAPRVLDPTVSETAERWADEDEAEFAEWRTQTVQSIDALADAAARLSRD